MGGLLNLKRGRGGGAGRARDTVLRSWNKKYVHWWLMGKLLHLVHDIRRHSWVSGTTSWCIERTWVILCDDGVAMVCKHMTKIGSRRWVSVVKIDMTRQIKIDDDDVMLDVAWALTNAWGKRRVLSTAMLIRVFSDKNRYDVDKMTQAIKIDVT